MADLGAKRQKIQNLLDELKRVERAARGGKPTAREADAVLRLTTFFPDDFTTAFTPHSREMALAIESAALYRRRPSHRGAPMEKGR